MKRRIIVTEAQLKRLALNEEEIIPTEVQQIMDEYNLVEGRPIRELLGRFHTELGGREDIKNLAETFPEKLAEMLGWFIPELEEIVHYNQQL